ncbi:chaperonin 10-like protein [Dipodascopsis tothii]|uniref:chaperonin 10-like protein n=1 Tax=Dipodascopsis tothii TaxID=44089 RepID=UPI0034CE57A2
MSDGFIGYQGLDAKSVEGNLVKGEFTPKTWTEDDIDIDISHCGMCASDLHTLRSGWGETLYPVIVGHEIIGTVVKKGANVKHLELGDRVGVGAQCYSCLEADCPDCSTANEQYCAKGVFTYNSKFEDGSVSYGGYALKGRYPASFAFKIPEALPSAIAAPMMCGGITVYSPLKRNGCGPGKTVGIVGIGGLGHFAVLYAKALGAEKVYGISRNRNKEADVKSMGGEGVIATSEEGWSAANKRKFDLILSTNNDHKMPLTEYLGMLKPSGRFVQVGLPEAPLPQFSFGPLIMSNASVTGSLLGSREEIEEMLSLSATQGVKTWITSYPMSEVNDVLKKMENNEARYRFVLEN